MLGVITSVDSENNNIDIVGQGCGSGSSGGTHQDLMNILILVVGMEALNDNIQSNRIITPAMLHPYIVSV
jgi:hypothetical protein